MNAEISKKIIMQNAKAQRNDSNNVSSLVLTIFLVVLLAGVMSGFGFSYASGQDQCSELRKSIIDTKKEIQEYSLKISTAEVALEAYTSSEHITPLAQKMGLRASLPEQRADRANLRTARRDSGAKAASTNRRFYTGVN